MGVCYLYSIEGEQHIMGDLGTNTFFLPALASEQGNVIRSVPVVCTKKFVIKRTRDLVYLKFVAIAPVLAKTPVIQCSPCYSAVSALLMNPLPDHFNYSPLLPHPLYTPDLVSSGETLYQAAPLETNTSLLQRFTAESSRERRRNAVP